MSDKIYVGIDDKKIEAKGEVLEQILKDRAEFEAQQASIEAEQTAKAEAKASAVSKLTALGLNENEINAIIGGI
jgi:regulator of protease activity HflC (stomatin/prohibitin superfamily)